MSRLSHRSASALRPLALALVMALASAPLSAATFNYHGQLMDGDAPASGRYDLRMRSFAQADAKAALAAAVELPNVQVIDGSFAVELDLPEAKIGDTFVEVAVRKAESNDAFEVLGAPQKIAKANNGCWALDGNTGLPGGNFIGNADPASTAPLVLRARNTRVAAFTPIGTAANFGDAPQVLLGSAANSGGFPGATVGGGGATLVSGMACPNCGNLAGASFATVAGGRGNRALGNGFATVGGGESNTANGVATTVSGGALNYAGPDSAATVSGGSNNAAQGNAALVAGGLFNVASGASAAISGGSFNYAHGVFAVVAGGNNNCAGGDQSLAAGSRATIRHGNGSGDVACLSTVHSGDADGDEGTFVWSDARAEDFISSAANQFLIRADGGIGVNTATMGAATNLRSGEIVVKNSTTDPNTDITLLNSTNRGFGLVSEPGASGNPGRFYITEVDARAAGVLFTPRLRINVDGTTSVVGGAVTNISDARVKKNIAAIEQPLETLLELRGHTFEYIDPAASMNPPGTRIGFIAQEVREVLPQWIADVGDGRLGVQTSGFEALAVEAIRDLKQGSDARIDTLERDNAALRAQLAAVFDRLARIEARAAGVSE